MSRGLGDVYKRQGVGDINVDFADVQTIMQNMGKAVIGKGTAAGKDRMNLAMQDALQSSLMEDVDIRGAKGILVHVLGQLTLRLLKSAKRWVLSKTLPTKT